MTKNEMLEELKKGKRMTRKPWKATGYYLQSLSDNPYSGTIDIKYSLHLALNNGGSTSASEKGDIYDHRCWDADDWEEIESSEFKYEQPYCMNIDNIPKKAGYLTQDWLAKYGIYIKYDGTEPFADVKILKKNVFISEYFARSNNNGIGQIQELSNIADRLFPILYDGTRSIKECIGNENYASPWYYISEEEVNNYIKYDNKDFFSLFKESIAYPDNLAETGVPQDTLLSYVSNTFLNGFVNYVDIKHVIMIERYTKFDADKIDRFIEWLNNEPNTKYDNIQKTIDDVVDDIILFGETDNSCWFFWSDRDCSDCNIGRISSIRGFDATEFKDMFINWLKGYKECYSGNYVELPIPKGWITL